jgi:DNA polymerase-3 subunit epsilon
MKIALLDVETTGLDASIHEILEIAVVVFDDETLKILDQYETKVHPEYIATAHPKALAVNGYTPEEWDKAGAVYLEEMMKTLSNGTKDCVMMAFNAGFDMSFLQQASKTTGIELYFKRYPICLRAIAWATLDHRNPFDTWSMRETCLKLGIEPEPAQHRAMNGVMCEFEIYKALKHPRNILKDISKEDLKRLMESGGGVITIP